MLAEQQHGIAAIVARVIAWLLQRKLVRAALLYTEQSGPRLADGVTYRTLFSVFAGVLLGFSIAALWLSGNPEAWQALITAVNNVVPGLVGKGGVISAQSIDEPAAFTVAGIASLAVSLATAIGAIGSLRVAFRSLTGAVYDDAFWLWVLLRNLALAIGVGVALAASAAVTMVGTAGLDLLSDMLGIGDTTPVVRVATRVFITTVIFGLDAVMIAVMFRVLSGIRPSRRALWSGATVGAVGLVVLQELSALFVAGATRNELLAVFGSLIALLLWLNLSAQVILFAAAYIITGVEEDRNRVGARYGATTFAERRIKRAEVAVQKAVDELHSAREAAPQ